MAKLIATYRKVPTAANRARLVTYMQRHMMAACLASVDEIAFLKANGFSL